MGAPRTDFSTCRYCDERVYWRRPVVRADKVQENIVYNEAYKLRQNQWLKQVNEGKAWSDKKQSYHYAEIEKREEPHPNLQNPHHENWFHWDATEREHYRVCTKQPAESERPTWGWMRNVATPKDYCVRDIPQRYGRDLTCNRPVKEVWDHEPLCGTHLAVERRLEKKEQKEREEHDIRQWARESIEEKCERMKKFGLEASVHTQRVGNGNSWEWRVSGKVVVDPDVLLALLDEEEF